MQKRGLISLASPACSTSQTNSDPSGAAPVGAYLAAGQQHPK